MPVPVPDQLLRVAIILSIVAVSGLLWRYAIPPGTTARSVVHVGVFCFNLGLISYFGINFLRRRLPSIQVLRRLDRGECPGCLYELAGLPAERIEALQAATRCPECGAVWRAERVRDSKKREAR